MSGEKQALINAINNYMKVESESYRAASLQQRSEFMHEMVKGVVLSWEIENLMRIANARAALDGMRIQD